MKGLETIFEEEFNQTWKLIAKQSERQLGAFAMLWFIETGTFPGKLSSKMVELRNKVIHQGKIPTYEECLQYGKAVIALISPIHQKILDQFPDAYKDECFALAKDEGEKSKQPLTVLSILSPLDTAIRQNVGFETCLENLKLHRNLIGIPPIGSDSLHARKVTMINESSTSEKNLGMPDNS